MMRLRVWWARVRGMFGGQQREADLRREISAHLDEARERFERQNVGVEEARRRAFAQFGGVTQTIETHREHRRFHPFSSVGRDLAYAVRMLMRSPGFTLVAILTLAIGILGTTTIFSGVNAILFTPLPAERPEQLAEVVAGPTGMGPEAARFGRQTYELYTALRDNSSALDGLIAIRETTVPISDTALSAKEGQHLGIVRAEIASGNYFAVLGIRAALGRTFTTDDDRTPNAHPLVVISDRLWRSRFNADPQTLGRALYLNGNPYTVIGVLPPTFTGTVFASETDVWAPLMMQGQLGEDPDWWRPGAAARRAIVIRCATKSGEPEQCGPPQQFGNLRVLGRLKKDVPADVASAQLTALAANIPPLFDHGTPLPPPKITVVAELAARHENVLGEVHRISTLAMCASILVWLIACGNVANLLLARATVRRREIAIRLSMGAGRWRVVRQLLTESTLLAMIAGAIAIALTYWTSALLGAAIPANVQLPITLDFTPDLRVLGAGLGLSLLTGLAFGCAPALQAARTNLISSLKPGESGSRHGARRFTLRNALVVAQLSMSVVVLICGGLFVRSLENARNAFVPGFDADRLLSMRVDPGLMGYKAPRIEAVYRDILRLVQEVPRLESASLVSRPPFGSGGSAGATLAAEGRPSVGKPHTEAEIVAAGPRYFATMGITLAAGRDFNERDASGSTAVGILSEPEAQRLFGSAEAAIGKGIVADEDGQRIPRVEIVGVAAEPHRAVFVTRVLWLPSLQRPALHSATLVVRAAEPGALTLLKAAVQEAVRQADPALPITEVRTGEDHADPKLGAVRLTAEVSMLLGLVALTLAALGLYGVVSYAVSTRTREIGIRLALGAHAGGVRGLIVRHGLLLTSLGVAIGVGGALLLTPVLQSFLVDLPANDPATFGVVSATLVVIALVACYLPARRAARVDPIATLRTE